MKMMMMNFLLAVRLLPGGVVRDTMAFLMLVSSRGHRLLLIRCYASDDLVMI